MRLILSTFLRTLRERDQFDALLPDLLLSMGIVPLSKPQTGTRQFGVDLSAAGKDADDAEKLFLFVLKKGDIDRHTWNSDSPQSVRPSLDEILDVYLRSHVPPKFANLPIKIVLGTTGDLKEAVQANWAGYGEAKSDLAEFEFWGADKIASLIERYMLDEHLFQSDDRTDLRRTLALVGESDYSLADFHQLLLRQLGLNDDGSVEQPAGSEAELGKAIVRVNLATRLVAGWDSGDGDTKAALKASERALLWTWWRLLAHPEGQQGGLLEHYRSLLDTYFSMSKAYVEKLKPYCRVRDGLCGYTGESAVFSLIVFEHIGFMASIGLSALYCAERIDDASETVSIDDVMGCLIGIIQNNPVSGSPSLDEHSIDISLAMALLTMTGNARVAKEWLSSLVPRADYTYRSIRNFPVGTDSLDDLVELHFAEPPLERRKELMQTSWTLPILAGWSVIFDEGELYEHLVSGEEEDAYPEVCRQLWHPVKDDFFDHLYFRSARFECGETEAPIHFDKDVAEYRKRMRLHLDSERHEVLENSPAYEANLFGIDIVAYRHFRTPPPPSYWYQFLPSQEEAETPDGER